MGPKGGGEVWGCWTGLNGFSRQWASSTAVETVGSNVEPRGGSHGFLHAYSDFQ